MSSPHHARRPRYLICRHHRRAALPPVRWFSYGRLAAARSALLALREGDPDPQGWRIHRAAPDGGIGPELAAPRPPEGGDA